MDHLSPKFHFDMTILKNQYGSPHRVHQD